MGLLMEVEGKKVEIYVCPVHQTIMKKPNQDVRLPAFCPECRKNGDVVIADIPEREFEALYGKNWKPYIEPEIEVPRQLMLLRRKQKITEYKENIFKYIKVAN